MKSHLRSASLSVLVLFMILLSGCDFIGQGSDKYLETFKDGFVDLLDVKDSDALGALYDTYLDSENWDQLMEIALSHQPAMLEVLNEYYLEESIQDAIQWSILMDKWFGIEIRETLEEKLEAYLLDSLRGYQDLDMVSLTDLDREVFFKHLEKQISVIDSNLVNQSIFDLDALFENVVLSIKSEFDSATDFETFSKIAYYIKSYRLEVLMNRVLNFVKVTPYESKYSVTNIEGNLTFDIPEDEYLYVLKFSEIKEMKNIMLYIDSKNRYTSSTLRLDEDDVYYVIAVNQFYQPCDDVRVFYGKLDFSRYISIESETQDKLALMSTYALEEMEKYRGLIEPLLISGFYGYVFEDKMLVRLDYLDTIVDYDLDPFNMKIVESIEKLYASNAVSLGMASGFKEILIVSHENRVDFDETFHHEMMHVLETYYNSAEVSYLNKTDEMMAALDELELNKRETFSLLEGKYVKDYELNETELGVKLDEILNTSVPLRYGVVSGYSRFSHREDSAEIWAYMMVKPNEIDDARANHEVIQRKVDYIQMIISEISKLNGSK